MKNNKRSILIEFDSNENISLELSKATAVKTKKECFI